MVDTVQDEDFRRVELSQPLPCAMPRCAHSTTTGLIERNVEQIGLWTLLPICEGCATAFRGKAYEVHPSERHLQESHAH